MKTHSQDLLPCFRRVRVTAVALTALLAAALPSRALTKVTATVAGGSAGAASSAVVVKARATGTNPIVIERFETDAAGERLGSRKEVAWLGLATDEATEALAAQLKLSPGVGLVVNYVDPQGPAAKAGLEKNDLLVRFEDQSLVHPAQLRKLVQARKEGDAVQLEFYRSGEKRNVSVTLAKTTATPGPLAELGFLPGQLHEIGRQMDLGPMKEALRQQMTGLRDELGRIHLDNNVQVEIRRSIEEAKKAIHEAMKNATNSRTELDSARRKLHELSLADARLDGNTSVIVRDTGRSARSLVKTDDSGTIVLVRNPKLRLTAHDANGKLLFDGEIETADQRDQVPRELWKKVEPLVLKLDRGGSHPEPHPDAEMEE